MVLVDYPSLLKNAVSAVMITKPDLQLGRTPEQVCRAEWLRACCILRAFLLEPDQTEVVANKFWNELRQAVWDGLVWNTSGRSEPEYGIPWARSFMTDVATVIGYTVWCAGVAWIRRHEYGIEA